MLALQTAHKHQEHYPTAGALGQQNAALYRPPGAPKPRYTQRGSWDGAGNEEGRPIAGAVLRGDHEEQEDEQEDGEGSAERDEQTAPVERKQRSSTAEAGGSSDGAAVADAGGGADEADRSGDGAAVADDHSGAGKAAAREGGNSWSGS